MELYYSYETRNGFSMSVVNLRLKLVFSRYLQKSHFTYQHQSKCSQHKRFKDLILWNRACSCMCKKIQSEQEKDTSNIKAVCDLTYMQMSVKLYMGKLIQKQQNGCSLVSMHVCSGKAGLEKLYCTDTYQFLFAS